MAKTANNIELQDAMIVAGQINFASDNNKVVIGDHNLTLTTSGSIASADDNEYVVTNGTGSLIKPIPSGNTYTHEIGDASNYTPLSSVISGTGFTSATLAARVYTTGLTTKYTETSDFINREWEVVASGIADYENTLTGDYVLGDIGLGTQPFIKGATHHGGDWHFDGSSNAPLKVIASTDVDNVKFSGKNFFGKVNVKAFLQGPYSGGTMSTLLNSIVPANNILEANATSSPYADAMASVLPGFFLANPNIVDWVKLELRDPNFPSATTTFKASAFIKNNGDVVGLDGVSLPRVKNGFETSVIVLSHRNHLPIRTVDAGLDVVNPTSQHNFSSGLGQAYDNTSIANDAMVDLGSGVYGLFRGNANGDLGINIIDAAIAKSTSVPIKSNVYLGADVNTDGAVNVIDAAIAKSASVPIKSAHN
jgi:hypothetical protein